MIYLRSLSLLFALPFLFFFIRIFTNFPQASKVNLFPMKSWPSMMKIAGLWPIVTQHRKVNDYCTSTKDKFKWQSPSRASILIGLAVHIDHAKCTMRKRNKIY